MKPENTSKPKLRYHANQFELTVPYVEKPGALAYLGQQNTYWCYTAQGVYVTQNLKAAAAFRAYGDERVQKIFNRAFQAHYRLEESPLYPDFVSILPLLDPHQREGLEWILTRKRSYLAHAPGAGKTAQAILAACLAEGKGQTLFIVPPSLTVNWEREIWKFTEWLGVFPTIGIVPRSAKQESMAWRADFIICPDSMLTADWVYPRLLAMQKKLIAVDEASRFKDPWAGRSLALYGGRSLGVKYPGLFQDARHVVFMDGSPMPNRPIELWAPTYALHPEAIDCMSYDDFGYRYCGARPNEYGKWEYNYSSHEEELKSKLQKDFMHVVSESELSHPERLRTILPMDQDVRSAEHQAWDRENLWRYTFATEFENNEISHYRHELGIRKVPWIARYVRQRLEDKNESILLFAWHRDVCAELSKRLAKYNPGLVIGGTSSPDREKYFEEFQSGKRRLLIMNIAAGGRGHNLQRANRVIFGEFSWTDEWNRQCEKRASRRGNEELSVRCEYIVAPNSVDDRVMRSLFSKQRRVERIIGA